MKQTKTVYKVIQLLKKTFPNIRGIRDASKWGDYIPNMSIHLGDAAEGGTIGGNKACDYNVIDNEEKVYILGVHKKLRLVLEDNGFYPECHDPGTYLAFRF